MRDEPEGPEWEGDDTFTCSSEVERKFVTPAMEQALRRIREGAKPVESWLATRTPEQIAAYKARAKERDLSMLLDEWVNTEAVTRTCGYEGEAHYVIVRGRILWDCPACGEEHDDGEAVDRWGPDPDAARDARMEAMFDGDID